MEIIRIPRIMQETSRHYITKSKKLGFVPTMGALHEGHLSLVRRAKDENDLVVVSIFLNPKQFGANEDLSYYPKPIESDIEKLQSINTDILFLPETSFIYPTNFCTYITVQNLSDKLCGPFRPGHFTGVTTVVCKLLNMVMPSRLYLGQKDYQQLLIIKRMVEDLNIPVEIIPCRTIREKDGLAMSSRNSYLKSKERLSATVIYKTLSYLSNLIVEKKIPCHEVKGKMKEMLLNEPLIEEIQYASIYDPETLDELDNYKKVNLLAVALKIGNTRLIDNMIVEINSVVV
ncbi:MAG TPA: pantoate--beta-alanine ligase [Nitrospirae bacterium]|nr:pantoate--beta-alanine ligase [Nitrospirota bacterium]